MIVSKVLILNAHLPGSSPGRLTASLIDKTATWLQSQGHQVKVNPIQESWDTAQEVALHVWADVIILQAPVHWMSVPWLCKKYLDEVYSAANGGILFDGDGRKGDPSKHYGSGGTAGNKKYMLSLTFNAPEAAFNNDDQYLFQGKGVDDLFMPIHMNFRFFAMQKLDTFVCYDVVKDPDIANDFARLEAHLGRVF